MHDLQTSHCTAMQPFSVPCKTAFLKLTVPVGSTALNEHDYDHGCDVEYEDLRVRLRLRLSVQLRIRPQIRLRARLRLWARLRLRLRVRQRVRRRLGLLPVDALVVALVLYWDLLRIRLKDHARPATPNTDNHASRQT